MASGTLALALAAAALCAASGFVYLTDEAFRPVGGVIGTLGLVGASALVATGIWQLRAVGRPRLVVLLALVALAGGYVVANSFGLVVTDLARQRSPRGLHWAGLGAGIALYLVSLLDVTLLIRTLRAEPSEPSGNGQQPAE